LKPLLLLAAFLACPAWAEEPLGFKGMTLGAANLAVTQDPRFDCRVARTPTADQICTLRPKEQETIAGAPVSALYYFFDRAHLTGIVISLPEQHFTAVGQALTAKYGEPKVSVETVKTLSGRGFENRKLVWSQGTARLEAQRYAGQVNRSLIRLSDQTAAERVRQRRATAPGQDL
jgi:hypothetical protein